MDLKPIPAFYCCYLLRSTVRHASLYVGSTTDPRRRLAQHNGNSKGGAVRTAKNSLRPWEVTCIVTGFPSNIAALQFEWAWQNTHLTRRIADEQRITVCETKVRTSPKTGRSRKRPARPRTSLVDKLSNLHLLLRVPSFARWPLEVCFFSEDVYQVWQRWSDRIDGNIRGGIKIVLDQKALADPVIEIEVPLNNQTKGMPQHKDQETSGLESIDVGYGALKPHLEKSLFMLAESEINECAICMHDIAPTEATVVVCPVQNCRTATHLTCLSNQFLEEEDQETVVIPTSGLCPTCKTELRWVDLIKEMSLRIRGEKNIARLMKKPRERKTNAKKLSKLHSTTIRDDDDMSHEHDDGNRDDDIDSEENEVVCPIDVVDEPRINDGWRRCDSDEDVMSTTSVASDLTIVPRLENLPRSEKAAPSLEIVIEDSDWDNAEVLD